MQGADEEKFPDPPPLRLSGVEGDHILTKNELPLVNLENIGLPVVSSGFVVSTGLSLLFLRVGSDMKSEMRPSSKAAAG